jgi:hypothetical protein
MRVDTHLLDGSSNPTDGSLQLLVLRPASTVVDTPLTLDVNRLLIHLESNML